MPAAIRNPRPPAKRSAALYARVLAGDPLDNGRFFFGVTTTGIYCLPSCKARKPKPENTRFFPTADAARAAGLRPCKKCHPDDFARGADPVLEAIEQLVSEIRAQPAAFADTRAIVHRSGFGPTRLFELFRQHYHATPADLLLRSRLAHAQHALLTTSTPLADVAHDAGFASLSAFHENFRTFTALTPSAYRDLRDSTSYELSLPADYPLAYLKRFLGRDTQSVTERLEGDTYTTVARLGPEQFPARITLEFQRFPAVAVTLDAPTKLSPHGHTFVTALLGLDQDAAAFSRLARKLGFARLVAGRPGLRLSRMPSLFDGLLWSIIGQQINLPFAFQLRRRLYELAGEPHTSGLYAPPTPAAIAALNPDALRPLQFSRSKATYVIDTARQITTGALDLDALSTMSATRVERTLLDLRGLGPWSVNFVMMRSLGFADCVPLGDTGVTSGLQKLLRLETRPDVAATKRLMSVFSPYRSLATAHLWQLNLPTP